MWRKSRKPGKYCIGTDMNRNFGFHWGESGASTHECAETYQGTKAFSEPETKALATYLTKYSENIKLYLSFHSYGQYILYPWGYTLDHPDDIDELYTLAIGVEEAIRAVRGTRYTVGSTPTIVYAGDSDDWAKGVSKIQLSYTIELPGGGHRGFDLPASSILEVANETFEGVKFYQQHIETKFALLET